MKFLSTLVLCLLILAPPLLRAEKKPITKGVLNELQLNKKTEAENLKTAASVENLISKSEEKAIEQLEILIKKFKGSTQEPDLIFRLAELYARRAKTGRFVDLYRGDKTLSEILTPKLSSVGAKSYLSQAIKNYSLIQTKYPRYPAIDEVLFNLAFAYEQRGDSDLALKNFNTIVEKHQGSPLLPETHMALGELYFIKQKYTESLMHYEKIQEWPEAPIAPIALYKSSWCSYNLKNTLEAIQKMERLLSQSKDRPLMSHVRSEAKRDLALFFSEVGEPKNSISYFKKHLNENEIGPTVLDLSTVYERHGKLPEMDLVLALFLETFPEDVNAGLIYLRRVQHLNEALKFNLVIETLKKTSKLCTNNSWKNKAAETLKFCNEIYPAELKEIAAEWWENWNKLKRANDMIPQIAFIFSETIKFENPLIWNVSIHMSYADFLFYQKSYKEASIHYIGVSKIEGLDKKILPEALYGAIVSLDRNLALNPKNQDLRQQLLGSINEYLLQCPKCEYINDALFKKAYLFFEEKEYDQALLWISKITLSSEEMKEKKEDLTLEIHRTKKDFTSLEKDSFTILKTSKGDRHKKIKEIYQGSQQAIIQVLINDNKLKEAIDKSFSFYEEHKPEEKALDSLHLSIELLEKTKKIRVAAEHSESLAKELKKIKKDKEADTMSQHAVQLFLQLGDLIRAQESLVLSTSLALEDSKKRENLELSTEISSWYGNIESIDKTWNQLEVFLNKEEKSNLNLKKFDFFKKYAPEKANQMKKNFIEKGLEPYFSESQLNIAKKFCEDKKWTQCYQLSLKLNRDSTPTEIRAEARYLQTKVLFQEYLGQSLKAPPDRMGLVMSYKAEKFDKLVQVLNTVSQKSEIVTLRKQAVQDLIFVYNDYVTQLKASLSNFDLNNQDLANLNEEIKKILPLLESRPKELEVALVELNNWEQNNKNDQAKQVKGRLAQITGQELRVYVPTWEEGVNYRPLGEIKGSEKRCRMSEIVKMNTLSSLGGEANLCLLLNRNKELETISLKLSDLFPDLPWGPYYLSLMASQIKSEERALWFLKLSQKREKNPLLAYEEQRKTYSQSPDSITQKNLTNIGGPWALIEEVQFLNIIGKIKKQKCETLSLDLKELRSEHWKKVPFKEIIASQCTPVPVTNQKRSLSNSDF